MLFSFKRRCFKLTMVGADLGIGRVGVEKCKRAYNIQLRMSEIKTLRPLILAE